MNGVCGIYVILFYPAFVLFQRFRTGEKNQINDQKTFISFLFNFMSDAGVWAYN